MSPKADTRQRRKHERLDIDERELEALAADEKRLTFGARLKRIFIPATREDVRIYRRLLPYVKPYMPRMVFATILAAVGAVALSTGQLFVVERGLRVLVGTLADDASLPRLGAGEESPGAGRLAKDGPTPQEFAALSDEIRAERRGRLREVVFLFLGLVVFGAVAKFAQALIMSTVTRKVIRHLRDDCFEHLVQLPLRFHQTTHSGKIIARVTKDINKLRELLISITIGTTREAFTFIGAFVYVAVAASWAVLIALAFLLLAIVPVRLVADRIRHRDREEEAGQADVFAILSEALAGQKVVKAFSGEKHEVRKFKKATKSVYRRQLVTQRLRAITEPALDLVGGFGLAAAIWVLGGWVLTGGIEFAAVATVLIALQRMNTSIKKLGKMNNDFVRGITAAERVTALLDVEPEVRQHADAVPLACFTGGIRFENVTFGYEPGEPVLKDVSIEIPCGATVAIVGPSGAGKTSLVDLVPRFYDVDEGRVTIDGRDVRAYTLKSLRANVGIVSQDTVLFRDSIRENIAYGLKDVGDDAVIAAAQAANAHDFIVAKEEGYDTPLGERGLRLSGGERQRLAIARALLKNPPILILDEATSALDAESEAKVQDALDRLMRGRTTLVIAHRLSTIARADRIVVLAGGRVVEQGTHDELLRVSGRYAAAYRLQIAALERGEGASLDEFFGGRGDAGTVVRRERGDDAPDAIDEDGG